MKRKYMFTAMICLLFIVPTATLFAQATEENVSATISHLDSAFWKAYNNCDTAAYTNFIWDDVEFYHDKGGITDGAKALSQSLAKNLCSNANYRLRREAVAGTVHVYPMQKDNQLYGAVISGEHVFYITANSKPEYLDGQASFTHLWLLKDGVWKMSRILSYNHHPADYINKRKEVILPEVRLSALTGRYVSKEQGSMNVQKGNGVLILTAGNNSFTLYPQADTLFFTKERDLVFEFVLQNGKPLKMIVRERGAIADEAMFEK